MKKSMLLIVLCLLIVSFSSTHTCAQENEEYTMFLVIEESVSPADMQKFWKVQSEALKKFDEFNFDMTFRAYRTDDNSFYWSLPIKSFACIDDIFAKMMNNHKIMLENDYDPSQAFRDLSTMSQFVVSWNKALSYNPDNKPDYIMPDKFYEWVFIFMKPGHEKEAAEATKKYKEFYDSIEESYAWNTYEVMFGNNTPCWIMEVTAESEAALRQKEVELMNKYGEDFQKLWQNFVQHVNSFETKKGWFLPGWSRPLEE